MLQFLFRYIKKHKWQYIAGIITLFVVDIANIFIPKMTGVITDGLTQGTIAWNGIVQKLWMIFVLGVTLAVGRFLWRYFLFGASRQIERELRDDMFSHLTTMDVEFYNRNKTGDLMMHFTSDLDAIRQSIGIAVICVFDAVVMSLMVIIQMMYYVNMKLTLVAIIPMLMILFGELYYGRIIQKRYLARQEAVSQLTDFVQESFSGIRVIKAFVREKAQRYAFLKENQNNASYYELKSLIMKNRYRNIEAKKQIDIAIKIEPNNEKLKIKRVVLEYYLEHYDTVIIDGVKLIEQSEESSRQLFTLNF